MSIHYYTTPVCVSFVRSSYYIGYTKGWEDSPHFYYRKIYIGEDLLHLKYIKRR